MSFNQVSHWCSDLVKTQNPPTCGITSITVGGFLYLTWYSVALQQSRGHKIISDRIPESIVESAVGGLWYNLGIRPGSRPERNESLSHNRAVTPGTATFYTSGGAKRRAGGMHRGSAPVPRLRASGALSSKCGKSAKHRFVSDKNY